MRLSIVMLVNTNTILAYNNTPNFSNIIQTGLLLKINVRVDHAYASKTKFNQISWELRLTLKMK